MSHAAPETLNAAAESELALLRQKEKLTARERMAIPAQPMPEQDPEVRRHNVSEVAVGYSPAQAVVEAMRCLQCANAPCIKDCPVNINISAFVAQIAKGDFQSAIDIIKTSSLLPAVCGRVCPQESQCQKNCTVGKALKSTDKGVAIGRLERFVADWERETQAMKVPEVGTPTGKKVAVVGSGPAGLVVAADCRRAGHEVTVFEAFHKTGGVMIYGIPEFRLPKAIVQKEVDTLEQMGVEISTDFVVGRTRKLLDLMKKDGFDAVFVGTGAGLPHFMGIEGENLIGVFAANEYLTRANLMKAFDSIHAETPIAKSKRVAVIGGGNVAMDAARSAVRLGAEEVHLLYRRTEAEMPARIEEVGHAKEEGVIFHTLVNPLRYIADEQGRVCEVECLRYALGEPDASGRPRPIEIPGSEFRFSIDTAIVSIGNGSNPLIRQTTPGLETDKRGRILTDENQKTSVEGVYAGGDIVLGAATVILAMGEGRKAAAAINEYLAAKK